MYLKVFGNIKIIKILMVILTILSFIFIYLLSEKIVNAEPNWDRVNKIQECQNTYLNCVKYCKDNDCLNKCADELHNCQN